MADVVDLIMEDHREVERLFEEMNAKPERRPMLMPVVTTLLIAHSRAEESEVYPVARDEAGEAQKVSHSQEEHAKAEELLERLKSTDHTAPEFDSVLKELIDTVTHHVEEEETSVLPGMKERLPEDRREELGEAFMTSRAKHMGEQPGEATKDELLQQADNVGAAANESMTKDEIEREIRP